MDEEEETVLLSFSFSEIRGWATGAGRVTSGTSGSSGISKDTAEQKQNKVKETANLGVLHQIDSILFKE